jgi:hypothetical protein
MAGESRKLSATEQEIWMIASSVTGTGFGLRLVLLNYKSVDYLFVEQDKLEVKSDSFYPNQEKIKLESLRRSTDPYAVFDEDGGVHNIYFELFIVKGFSSPDELVRATLRNIRHDVTVVRLDGKGTLEIKDRVHFEPLLGFGDRSGSRVRKFFRERRIVAGTFELAYVNHFLMTAVLNPLAIKEFLETGNVPKEYFIVHDYLPSEKNVYCPNKLYYVAEEEQFRFHVSLSRDPEYTDAERVSLIKRVLDFIFSDIDVYVRAEGEDSALLEVLGCSEGNLEKVWEAFHLWQGSYGDTWVYEEVPDLVQNWVRPEVIEVSIETVETDPSRGTELWESMKITHYSETIREWRHTKFDKIEPKAYLERLQKQHGATRDRVGNDEYSIFLDIPLEDLGLSGRTYTPLQREGIYTLGKLIALTEDDLLKIENLGPRGILEIPRAVSELGLGFLIASPSWPFVED